VQLRPLTNPQAEQIASWHYEGDFAVYDLHGDGDLPLAHGYLGAWETVDGVETLVGFVVFGEDARVPGLAERDGLLDVGVGVHPGLMGRGIGVRVAEAAVTHAREVMGAQHLRAAVQSWNLRSQALCYRMGFHVAGHHSAESPEGQRTEYEVFICSL
jgi:[ribosomal protein S18]-alanine N-acetyltransferase